MSAKESWSSNMGVILAVAGSAVGLGNFLKFPGQVAMYGGAAFMIAYVISFFILGMPIAFAEWTLGRHGGSKGFNSPPGILMRSCPWPKIKYFGLLGVMLTTIVYCYYIYIEAWCLGYAVNFAMGVVDFKSIDAAGDFFVSFIGAAENGAAISVSFEKVFVFFLVAFALNFWLIYRGVSKGIEFFCKYAMPTLVLIALILVVRVMTLGAVDETHPERNINQGLGFMWNPVKVVLEEKGENGEWKEISRLVGYEQIDAAKERVAKMKKDAQSAGKIGGENLTDGKSAAQPELRVREISVFEQLLNASIWIAAAGQVFFSLTVGFGAILTYASYLKKNDDIVLSALSSSAANEFCEVCLGGMITVPAAVAFFGVSGVVGAGLSLFDLGFRVLPLFFTHIFWGSVFGFMFFALLFLAAVTSSLSMLQPGIAFMEEAAGVGRKFSSLIMGVITFFISGFVLYFSKDLKAMDTFDFWIGQVIIFIFGMVEVFILAWVIGAKKGVDLANSGSITKLPKISWVVLGYITPITIIVVFAAWLAKELFGFGVGKSSPYISDLTGGATGEPNLVAWMCMAIIAGLYLFLAMVLASSKKYKKFEDRQI